MYDQVGGGFHRYSVDDYWLVPHFEKMLYDQALLAGAYLHGYLVTGEPRYRRVVEETIGYVLRDLRHADGGFFSAEDADSEGVEGKFYLWSLDELEEVVRRRRRRGHPLLRRHRGGNFVDPHTGYRGNILHVVDRDRGPTRGRRRGARRRCSRAASTRVRPGLDDKVLLGWNALFLRSLAEAAAALRPRRLDGRGARQRPVPPRELRRDDGRLLRSWQDGRADLLAYAEDYAALLEALLTLAEVDDVAWLDEARAVADELLAAVRRRRARRRSSPPAPTPRRSSCGPRTPGQRDAVGELARGRRAAPARRAHRRARATRTRRADGSRAMAPLLGEHPTAFAYLLGALERRRHAAARGRDRRRADDPAPTALRREVLGRLLPGVGAR